MDDLREKPPFGSPARELHYLARYTQRVAISNHRLVTITDDTVSFRWKDYRHGSQIRTLTLDVDEILRRFLCTSCRNASSASAEWRANLSEDASSRMFAVQGSATDRKPDRESRRTSAAVE